MNVLSVCDGIGAAHVAWGPLGWHPYVVSEIEPFPREVLMRRHRARDARRGRLMIDAEHIARGDPYPPLLWGDFTSIRERFLRRHGRTMADVDVLAGGTPCQSFSVAGLRGSLADARGNLSLAFVRLADAIDAVRSRARRAACWIVWENVPGVLSTRDNAFGAIVGGMVGGDAAVEPPRGGWPDAGVVSGPGRCAAWRVLDAQHFGLAQRRRRVIVVARGYFGGAGQWDGPDALLPVVAGRDWHPAPRREAGKRPAGTLSARTQGGGGLGTDFDLDGGLVSHALNAKGGGGRIDAESETFVVARTLKGGGFDASEDGTGRGVPRVPVAFAENSRAELRLEGGDGQTVASLKTGGGKPGQSYPAIAYRTTGNGGVYETGVAPTVTSQTDDQILIGGGEVDAPWMGVRRLTPRECERLQGFPDDYTAVAVRGRPAPDGPRYRALGNSWAVPKMRYVGERIAAVHARCGRLPAGESQRAKGDIPC